MNLALLLVECLTLSLSLSRIKNVNAENEIFELENEAPSLNKKVASRVIEAMRCFNVDYGNYNSTNENTTECKVGILATELKKTTTSPLNNDMIKDCLRKINSKESARASITDIDELTNKITSIGKENLKELIRNANNEYELIRILLDGSNNLSLTSKFCFHLASALYKNDCGYSKYDKIVRKHLWHYKGLTKLKKINKTEFDNHEFDKYKRYCNVIGEISERTKLTRNEIDQIIWTYFRQKRSKL